MTHSPTTDLSGDLSSELAGHAGSTMRDDLEAVRNSAAELLAGMHRPPSLLRIRAGEIVVELEWPGSAPAPIAPAPAGPAPAALPAGAAGPAAGTHDPEHRHICAPTVGVFYRSPEPGAPPFVREGDAVAPGQQVGIIEAMKLLIPIEADAHGWVVQVLKSDAEPVEYGEPLFALSAADPAQR